MRDDKIFKEIQKEILKETLRFARKIALIVERNVVEAIDEKDLRASADLRKSIKSKVIQTTYKTVVEVFSGMKYAVYVHEGTKPHFPPIEPIMNWVRKKGIGQQFSIKTKRALGTKRRKVKTAGGFSEGTYSKEIRSIAYAIAHGISKKGTKAVPFFKLGLAQSIPVIEREIRGFTVWQFKRQ